MNAETILQNNIRIQLSEFGICIRLNTGLFRTADGRIIRSGISGMPDLLFLGKHGQTVWLEVKTGKGRLSQEQERFINTLQEMGHHVAVVHSVDEALAAIGVFQ